MFFLRLGILSLECLTAPPLGRTSTPLVSGMTLDSPYYPLRQPSTARHYWRKRGGGFPYRTLPGWQVANYHQPSSQSGDRALLVSLGSLVVPTSEVSAFEVLHRSTIPVFSSPWDRLDLTISLCPHCPLLFLSLPSRTWPISRIGLSIQQLNTSPVLSSSYEPAFLTLYTSFD